MAEEPLINPPAFPCVQEVVDIDHGMGAVITKQLTGGGATLLDYYAAHALSPILVQSYGAAPERLAEHILRIAAACLKERQKYIKP